MAEDLPRLRADTAPPRTGAWSRDRIAEALVPRRDTLVAQLPRELATARGLSRDQAELVIDEAIDFMVTEYALPIRADEELVRAFWATASFRVRRVHEGRGATIRAGWKRVDIDDVEIAAGDADPVSHVVERDERDTVMEFAATLTAFEQTVLSYKYGGGSRELGRKLIARRLGVTPARVRKAERSIARKLERFAAIVTAGTLCAHRDPALHALAEARASAEQDAVARAHLAHCPACRVAYTTHLRAIQSGELQRRIGALLPLPAVGETRHYRSGLWDTVVDWVSRPFASDAANGASQAATAARGLGTAAAAKLAVLCIGGAAVVGGGAWCVSEISRPPAPSPRPHSSRVPRSTRRVNNLQHEHALVRLPAVTSTPSKPRRSTSRQQTRAHVPATPTATPGSSPVTTAAHEQATAVSPAAPDSAPAGASEFTPAPASAATPAPAAPAAGGGPEFP